MLGVRPSSPWDLLACTSCGGPLEERPIAMQLACARCGGTVPIEGGIPRFVSGPLNQLADRTRASFGYEWSTFSDPTPSGETNFRQYFADLDVRSIAGTSVLDAGCGIGRHARFLAPHVRDLVALDFSAAIEHAARNLAEFPNVVCVQGDITRLPVKDDAFDFVYSLGVLHHLEGTAEVLAGLVRKVRPGGRLRIYVYWRPSGWRGALLAAVNTLRPLTTRMPFSLLNAFCRVLSAMLWIAVILPYRWLYRLGVRQVERLPLFQYARYPFVVLYNDQFDRFSAPLEKRYTAPEVRALLETAGLVAVRVWPSYGWMAEGVRPPAPPRP